MTPTMQAIHCSRYGGPEVLELRHIPRPVPRTGTVIVDVGAAAVTAGDARIRGARFPAGMRLLSRLALGLRGPRAKVLGMSFAGRIVAVGPGVTGFFEGQRVLGMTGMGMGAHAEALRVRATAPMIAIPDHLDDVTAAALSFGGTTARHYLHAKAGVRPGDRVLIIGGSGQVGVAAVQIAKAAGAHVTTLTSDANRGLMRRLGADVAEDYRIWDGNDGAAKFDIIMKCAGEMRFSQARALLNPGGRFLIVAGDLRDMIGALRRPDRDGKVAIAGVASEQPDDLRDLVSLWDAGGFDPVVSHTFPLAEAAAAHAIADSGRKVGAVVLEMLPK